MNECKACGRPMLGIHQVYCNAKCFELGREPPLVRGEPWPLTPQERQSLEALREGRDLHMDAYNRGVADGRRYEREQVITVLWPAKR